MGKQSKRKIQARIAKVLPVEKVQNDSLQAKMMKEDEEEFRKNPQLSGFVREYAPGEFPEGHLTEQEIRETKYVLVKRSRRMIGGTFFGRYPLNQEQFEYFQEDPNRIDELEPAQDVHHFYQREE